MKKQMKKLIAAASVILSLSLFLCVTAGAYDISVRMDGIISDASEYVGFGRVKPVQLNSRTLVPARDMAEAAGLNVMWDQPTQTAILTLTANPYSDKPIERYAWDIINLVDTSGLTLRPVDITAALKLDESVAVIRYNFIDEEGGYIPYGTTYEMTSKAILIDDGTLMIPVRDSMAIFGLNVGWNQEDLCAYVSIPETRTIQKNLKIITNPGTGDYAPTEKNTLPYVSYSYDDLLNGGDGLSFSYVTAPIQNAADTTSSGKGQYLGNFKITHYCPCNICNGYWGAGTAWAGSIIPGQTIGVNPNVIRPLTWVYIDGYGLRRAEDTGSGIGQYHIDVAVPTHSMAMSMGVVYRDVYLAD